MPHLSNIHVIGFKRFHDLTISDLPASAKLVLLSGPNGIGKSSLFDAFKRWSIDYAARGWRDDPDYYQRSMHSATEIGRSTPMSVALQFHEDVSLQDSQAIRRAFYVRSAYRNDPELQIGSLQKVGSAIDESNIQRLIENDASVGKNYQRLVSEAFDDVFEAQDGSTTIGQWRESVIGPLRDALKRLFPNLSLSGLGSPLRDPNFRFSKGDSKGFLYKNLSGGEKAVFDLLLDIIVKRIQYNDTIYCIDEPEVHTNPAIQGKLLRELLRLVPDGCQLWISTHAIGMLREARDMAKQTPGEVVFINFEESHNFDSTMTLKPIQPTRSFWQSALSVALSDLADLVAPQQIIVCEGSPGGLTMGKNADHDARCYQSIFDATFPEAMFVSGGNSSDVSNDRFSYADKMPAIVAGTSVHRLIDRDDHGEAEIAEFNKKAITVLGRRNLQSYLWDEEVLKALCISRNRIESFAAIQKVVSEELSKSVLRGNPSDDVKSASPNIFAFIKRELNIVGEANDARAFERNILAKLLSPEMRAFKELKQSIFD